MKLYLIQVAICSFNETKEESKWWTLHRPPHPYTVPWNFKRAGNTTSLRLKGQLKTFPNAVKRVHVVISLSNAHGKHTRPPLTDRVLHYAYTYCVWNPTAAFRVFDLLPKAGTCTCRCTCMWKHALQKHHHGNQPGHMAICNLMALGNAMYTYGSIVGMV